MILKSIHILLCLASCYTDFISQYQQGYQLGVFWTQNEDHILISSTVVGRFIDIEQLFEVPFTTQPKVAIAISFIDIEAGTPTGYATQVSNVDTDGFTIRITALTQKQIKSIAFNWFATTDPRINIQYIDTEDLGDLYQDQKVLNIPKSLLDLYDNYLASSYLIGAAFGGGKNLSLTLKQKVSAINQESIDITFTSNNDVPIISAQICLVTSTRSSSFNTGELGLIVNSQHPWLQKGRQKVANVGLEFDIPSELIPGQRYFMSGLTGYEVTENKNLRINIQPIQDIGEHGSLSYGTWGDSELVELDFNAFFFGKTNDKVFGDSCSVVFSKCDFKGDNVEICQGEPLNWTKIGFKNQIKSVYIPLGGNLTLYSGQNQTMTLIFNQTDKCLEQWNLIKFDSAKTQSEQLNEELQEELSEENLYEYEYSYEYENEFEEQTDEEEIQTEEAQELVSEQEQSQDLQQEENYDDDNEYDNEDKNEDESENQQLDEESEDNDDELQEDELQDYDEHQEEDKNQYEYDDEEDQNEYDDLDEDQIDVIEEEQENVVEEEEEINEINEQYDIEDEELEIEQDQTEDQVEEEENDQQLEETIVEQDKEKKKEKKKNNSKDAQKKKKQEKKKQEKKKEKQEKKKQEKKNEY